MGTTESGKREHQKLKAYLILQILQRETDEEHTMSAPEIAAELDEIGAALRQFRIRHDVGIVPYEGEANRLARCPHRAAYFLHEPQP